MPVKTMAQLMWERSEMFKQRLGLGFGWRKTKKQDSVAGDERRWHTAEVNF